MRILSTPRPNGSVAERETRSALRGWLTRHAIPHRTQSFQSHPYFFECIGLWLIASRTLLAFAIWLRWGWFAVPIAFIGLLGGLLDVAFDLRLVTWPFARRSENILIEFGPPQAARELILSAHYDTKTELLDHRQRMFLLKNMPLGILLTVVLGLLGPLDQWLLTQGSQWAGVTFWAGVGLSIPMLLFAWGLGLNLSVGRLLRPSQGAVDNGAACAVLLGLAESLSHADIPIADMKVTIALFSGEEANMQGSRAYVGARDWKVPAAVVNLEGMAQNGRYVLWERDGNLFRLIPTSASINAALAASIAEVTGNVPSRAGPITSDGGSFLLAGIPTSTMSTYDSHWREGGLHRPSDNIGRVVSARLPEAVELLMNFLERWGEVTIANT